MSDKETIKQTELVQEKLITQLKEGKISVESLEDAGRLLAIANKIEDKTARKNLDISVLYFFKKIVENKSNSELIGLIKDYINEYFKLQENEDKEIEKLLTDIKEELNQLKSYMPINNLDEVLVKNSKGEIIKIKFAKNMKKFFEINVKKEKENVNTNIDNYWQKEYKIIEFKSKTDNIPFDLDLKSKPIKNDEKEKYNFVVDKKVHENINVNFYERYDLFGKDDRQIYYSFKKDGKVYLGVIAFKFNSSTGQISEFRNIVKEIKGAEKSWSEKALKAYQDKLYKNSIMDREGLTVVNDTILSLGNYQVATEEKTFKKLKKEYKNEKLLSIALKLLGAYIGSNQELIKKFKIGTVDKQGIGTGDITGIIITEDRLKGLGLDQELKNFYNLVEKTRFSPAEVELIVKDIEKYPDADKFTGLKKLQYISDFDSSGKIGDVQKTIIGEKTPYELIKKLPESEIYKKIKEIAKVGGLEKNSNVPFIEKYAFWRGLERLGLSPLAMEKYLSTNMSYLDAKKFDLNIQKQAHEKLLKLYFGKDYEKFKEKVEQKYNELIKQLPDKYKNDSNILDRLKNSINFAGLSALWVNNSDTEHIKGLAANFGTAWKVIDNLQLGVVKVGDKYILGVGLSKSFSKKFNENRTQAGLTGSLVNFVCPVVSLSASHDFKKSKLEEWDSSAKKVVASIGTAFPVMFASIGYNFGKASQIEYKEAKLNNFLENIKAKLIKGEKIDTSKMDNLEKQFVNVLEQTYKTLVKDKTLTKEDKEIILNSIIDGIKTNYKHWLYESNKGTRLSEIGVMWAIIPLVSAKMEQISVKYSLNQNGIDRAYKAGSVEKKSENLSDLVDTLNSKLGKAFELENGVINVDLSKLNKGVLLAFGDNVQVKKQENKLLIGGDISKVDLKAISAPGKNSYIVAFGENALIVKDNKLVTSNYIVKNNKGKLIDKHRESDIVNKIKLPQKIEIKKKITSVEKTTLTDKYINIKEQFKSTELYKLLQKSVDGGIFISKYKEKFVPQYEHLIDLLKEGKYTDAVNYISNVVFAKKSGMSLYVYHKIGQKGLDSIRQNLQTLQKSDILTQKAFVEYFMSNLFIDKNIKDKLNYADIKQKVEKGLKRLGIKITSSGYILPDNIKNQFNLSGNFVPFGQELYLASLFKTLNHNNLANLIQSWYISRMSLKQFDNSDIAGHTFNNRTAGFLRTLRQELGLSTLKGNLSIKGEKGVEKIFKQADYILNGNYPDWFTQLDLQTQQKLKTFYKIAKANKDYLEKSAFEKPTYATVEARNVIAFPFTYKLATKNHSHLPMYGIANLVDTDGSGKFDSNDYVKLDTSGVREYIYDMLGNNFKQSFKNVVNKINQVWLTDEQLKTLFLNKSIDINGKSISLNYDIGFTKWGECFNSTLILTNLKLIVRSTKIEKEQKAYNLGINVTTGKIYVSNTITKDVNEYFGGYNDDNVNKLGGVSQVDNSQGDNTQVDNTPSGSEGGGGNQDGSAGGGGGADF